MPQSSNNLSLTSNTRGPAGIPVRLWLGVGILLPVLLAGIIVILQGEAARRSVNALEHRVAATDAQLFADRLRAVLEPSEQDLEFVNALVQSRTLLTGDPDQIARLLFERVRTKSVATGAFLLQTATKSFIGASRHAEGDLLQVVRLAGGADAVTLEIRDDSFALLSMEERPADTFPIETRPWFQLAMSETGLAWTDPYYLFPSGLLGVTVIAAIVDAQQERVGMVGVTFRLRTLAESLSQLRLAKELHLAVMTREGELLADTFPEGAAEAGVARYLSLDGASTARENARAIGSFELEDKAGVIGLAPLSQADSSWLVMTRAIEPSPYRALRGAQTSSLAALGLAFVILSALWTLMAWRWLVRPVSAATRFSELSGQGSRPGSFAAGPLAEMRRLRDALVAMGGELAARESKGRSLTEALGSAKSRLEAMLDKAPLAIIELRCETADHHRITGWRGRSRILFGHVPAEAIGQDFFALRLVPERAGKNFLNLLSTCREDGFAEDNFAFEGPRGEGTARWHASLIERHDDQDVLLLMIEDDSERARAFAVMDKLASEDPLTGLANRRAVLEGLRLALAQSERRGEQLALWLFDIDNFKGINDGYGHADGDDVLSVVAERLRALVRRSDIAGRLGGDEFVVIQTAITEPAQIDAFGQRLRHAFAPPFDTLERALSVSFTCGTAVYPDDATTPAQLLRFADLALFKGKREGRGRFIRFTSDLSDAFAGRRAMEDRLRAAIEAEDLYLLFQPIWQIAPEIRLTGAEALLRWNDKGVERPPSVFVALAEESELIHSLGELALRLACRQIREWQNEGFSLLLSVNLSPAQLRRANLVDRFEAILGDHGVGPAQVELEVTESLFVESTAAQTQLEMLRSAGFRLAIDDFGTGYANLSSLVRLHPNRLKIDRRFIQAQAQDRRSRAIASAIAALARNLGITALAEGVETEEQLEAVKELGCTYAQGFYFGRPAEARTFEGRRKASGA